MTHYIVDCLGRAVMLVLSNVPIEASSCTMGSHDFDNAASLVAHRDVYVAEMGGRYRELGLAQRGILSHFLKNLVQQASRV